MGMAATPSSTNATPSPSHAGTPATGIRALVVEDEVAMAAVVGSYLEREGFEVTLSHDGLDAVRRAREVDPDNRLLSRMPV